MSELDRRSFLKTSVLGTSAALAAPSLLHDFSLRPAAPEEKNIRPVIRRTLGKTGISLPVVSMGVMRADSPALVRAALKAGIVLFDTAHGYQKGRNEEMLGEVFTGVQRSSYVIATKVPPEEMDWQTNTIGPGSTKEAFLKRLDESLRRLKLDFVDILYVHGISAREHVLHPAMIAAVTEAKKSGKTKFVGVSTHQNMETVIDAAVESHVYDVVLTSINFQYNTPDSFRKTTAQAAAAGIGIVAMKTMAGGYFDKEKQKPVNCKAALKWVLQDPNITTCIPGMTTFDQLQENISVNEDIKLTDEEKTSLTMRETGGGMYLRRMQSLFFIMCKASGCSRYHACIHVRLWVRRSAPGKRSTGGSAFFRRSMPQLFDLYGRMHQRPSDPGTGERCVAFDRRSG